MKDSAPYLFKVGPRPAKLCSREISKRSCDALKANLDIFWLKDDSLADTENLPKPLILAAAIIEDLEEALEEFSAVEEELKSSTST